jgi:hypothetical protein
MEQLVVDEEINQLCKLVVLKPKWHLYIGNYFDEYQRPS